MKEIKVRAWDKEKKRYFKVSELIFYSPELGGGVQYVIPDRQDGRYNAGEALQIMNVVLEEFTGLKDKNGKEGYAGDRITIKRFDSTFIIKRDTYNAKFRLYSEQCNHVIDIRYLPEEGEIIGNIHTEEQK